jgi:type VI secretion system protein ImpH
MAGTDGQTTHHLIEELGQRPFSFDFFRAVRLLECHFRDHDKVGSSFTPAQDPVRFAQNPNLNFAPSTIEAFKQASTESAPRMFLNFMGLMGPNGPLPLHVTEYAREREMHHKDSTIGAFLNIFNHRLVSLFYRAWAASQKALDLDRPGEQRFSMYLGSFSGLGLESMHGRDDVQDWAKYYFSGRLSSQTRNAEGLEAILAEYFEVKTELQTFVGRWIDLPQDSLSKLGDSPETGGLGVNTIAGSRIWDAQLNFRIRFGPMGLEEYQRLLPTGVAFKRLKQWVTQYCGEEFFWDIQFVLKANEVPDSCLGRSGQLGWTTWLKTEPFTQDSEDLILNPPHD